MHCKYLLSSLRRNKFGIKCNLLVKLFFCITKSHLDIVNISRTKRALKKCSRGVKLRIFIRKRHNTLFWRPIWFMYKETNSYVYIHLSSIAHFQINSSRIRPKELKISIFYLYHIINTI